MWGASAALVAIAGCSSEADPRPQIVVVVDTDAPVMGQVLEDAAISRDAAVDTLRIDVFDDGGNAYDYRDFVAPDADDWPISFGVAAEQGGGGHVHLRIRLFQGGLATSETLGDVIVLEPRREVAIDRLVDLELPAEGVRQVSVLLSFDCLGVSPSFVAPRTTCVDAARRAAPAAEGVAVTEGDPPASRVGTTALAREIPCAGPERPDTICVPGGFSVLGDAALWGIADGYLEDGLPLRPVIVSPFQIDRTEVTVGRLRELLQAGADISPLPDLQAPPSPDDFGQFCTFRGVSDATNDALPVNCVTWEAARQICEAAGGALPTEAQWEHAARGRGQGRRYPWGNESPSCCAASASRESLPDVPVECPGAGMEPPGAHPASDTCGGIGDVSRDGLLDLAGGLTEVMLDKVRPYSARCWGEGGILVDPVCEDAEASAHAARGGNWSSGLATTLSALRRSAVDKSAADGLRCAYAVNAQGLRADEPRCAPEPPVTP